jgi:glutamate carboxypeptidase
MRHQHTLDWIATQDGAMRQRLIEWCNINSSTHNLPGLANLTQAIVQHVGTLGDELILRSGLKRPRHIDRDGCTVELRIGPAIQIVKRPQSQRRVFLCIHTDTVYSPIDPFQTVSELPDGRLRGPGVADAKGGLVVMLTALAALERTEVARNIGWEVLMNPDEEIGSPSSAVLLEEAARRSQIGLLFEPCTDGALIDRRRGSGNFTIVIHGRAAHVGRDFDQGRSALLAAAELTVALHRLNESMPGVTVNVGAIDGGGPANVVADLAICRFNVRTTEPADEQRLSAVFQQLVADLNSRDGLSAELHGQFSAPPKIPDERGSHLIEATLQCAAELGQPLVRRPGGGACDGNRLAAAGLPNVDNLGVRGGDIHSNREFMYPQSLVERTQLAALILIKFAAGELGHFEPS